jgi:hypothetical protein
MLICLLFVLSVLTVLTVLTALFALFVFNAGIELDIDALERQLQAQQTQSIASNLIANNININTNKTTTIVGSNLDSIFCLLVDHRPTRSFRQCLFAQ